MNSTKTSSAVNRRPQTTGVNKPPRDPWAPGRGPTSETPNRVAKIGNKSPQNRPTEFPSLTGDGVSLSREANEFERIVLIASLRGDDTGLQGFLDRNPTERNQVLLQGIADWAGG